ncbi:MAG: AMP-binding protein, partial [Pseudomonadota bacterium]|nr:AMP-binding protein [Pseudomonadota bacterium]
MNADALWSRYGSPGAVASPQTLAALAQLDLEADPADGRPRVSIPAQANIAADTVGLHAKGERADRVSIRFDPCVAGEPCSDITFAELDDAASRMATMLRGAGVVPASVVAVHTGARTETVIVHLAIYKLGAIAATLSQLYGPQTIRHVLIDSAAMVLVTQDTVWREHAALRADCPALRQVVVVGSAQADEVGFDAWRSHDAAGFVPAATQSEDPALLVYTSGSTGLPKGVLHAHRIVHAYKPTLELFFDLELRDQNLVLWTAADWAWIGGLVDVVFPALQFGHRLIASQHRFEPEWALDFMQRHGVTHILLTPTALNRLAQVQRPRERYPDLRLRVAFTGGEPLPGATLRWLESELGVVCNEGYG